MKRLFVLMTCVLALGCDSSAMLDSAPEAYSGAWETTEVPVPAAAGQVSMQYRLQLDVADDGTFTGELIQMANGMATPGTQYWTGVIDAPAIRVLSYSPARAGGQLGAVQPLDGTISARSITFEGAAFAEYPAGELRFFPGR